MVRMNTNCCAYSNHVGYIRSAEIITNTIPRHTILGEAQLSAHHAGIRGIPEVITYGAKAIAHAHLHTSFSSVVPSNQPDCPLSTTYNMYAQS